MNDFFYKPATSLLTYSGIDQLITHIDKLSEKYPTQTVSQTNKDLPDFQPTTLKNLESLRPDLTKNAYPSANALDAISITLKVMQSKDRQAGLNSYEVQAFKNVVIFYMKNAITYESFLQR